MRSLQFRSRAQTRELLSQVHPALRTEGHGQEVGARMVRASAGGLSVDRLDVDATVSYDAAASRKVCLITVHRGAVVDTTGGRRDTYGPGHTFLIAPPDRPGTGELRAARCTITTFDAAVLDEVATHDHDPRPAGPVRLTGQRPLDAAANLRLGTTVSFLRDQVLADPDASGLVVTTGVRHLGAVVLATLPNTTLAMRAAGADVADSGPQTLERAIAFIADNAQHDITLADIAAAVCVTPRAVQYAFRRHAGTTPLGYLRRVRLAHAHSDLVAATPDASVLAIATKWGFAHQGRFAAAYRAAYGNAPSATLRAGPGRAAEVPPQQPPAAPIGPCGTATGAPRHDPARRTQP
ncbi:helix-turn-helix transcriptional regulator [Streptomyces zhihengii]|uniref:helix-turn-helix transcriptional regulator n=1 Tax=Streptomyces zhihengii TaxID=1818004 RepID=UPI0036397280